MNKKKIAKIVSLLLLSILTVANSSVSSFASEPLKEGESITYTSDGSFIAPVTGLYKLEVWGASSGGKGGYSSGYKFLEEGDIIYFHVGGGYRRTQHIAYKSGEMTTIGKSAWDNGVGILVAGCGGSNGGGNFGWSDSGEELWQVVNGGAGGGLNGGSAFYYDNDGSDFDKYFGGGSQTGGDRQSWGSAGYTGAGAGYYSGYGGISSNSNGGSGGSGWIAGCPTISFKGESYSATTESGVSTGDGKGQVTFIKHAFMITKNPITWTNKPITIMWDNIGQSKTDIYRNEIYIGSYTGTQCTVDANGIYKAVAIPQGASAEIVIDNYDIVSPKIALNILGK